MDVHIYHPRENESALSIHDPRRLGLKGSMGKRLDFASVDDDVPFEKAAGCVDSTFSDD
jgi:hypothetical protein